MLLIVYHYIISYMQFTYKEYVSFEDCSESLLTLFLKEADKYFFNRHIDLFISYVWGYDCSGQMVNEYPDTEGNIHIGGGSSGSGQDIDEPEEPEKKDTTSFDEIRNVCFVV